MAFMSEEEKRRQEQLDLIREKHGLPREKGLLDREIPIGKLGSGGGGIGKLFDRLRGKKKKEDEEEESNDEIEHKSRQADENLW